MLDLARMRSIKLSSAPKFQRFVARVLLTPNYRLPPRTQVIVENIHRLPEAPVIFAMNHTDRYNYWPFQYHLWRTRDRFTATWVKGKYYENQYVGKFMEWTNNIPTVSRGYLIAKDFLTVMERRPSEQEYATLRSAVDAAFKGDSFEDPTAEFPKLNRPRTILGRRFDPRHESYPEAIAGLFGEMMAEFTRLNELAQSKRVDTIIFPQGTRSKRLSKGHIGLAQMAQHLKATVVPIGCNGCDAVYPGSAPFAKPGKVVYRIGEPMTYEDFAAFHVPSFTPFSAEAESNYRAEFQGMVDLVMDRINDLLDDEYRFADEQESDGVQGSRRFV